MSAVFRSHAATRSRQPCNKQSENKYRHTIEQLYKHKHIQCDDGGEIKGKSFRFFSVGSAGCLLFGSEAKTNTPEQCNLFEIIISRMCAIYLTVNAFNYVIIFVWNEKKSDKKRDRQTHGVRIAPFINASPFQTERFILVVIIYVKRPKKMAEAKIRTKRRDQFFCMRAQKKQSLRVIIVQSTVRCSRKPSQFKFSVHFK